jgi:lysyl-tRNA synthetase class 2
MKKLLVAGESRIFQFARCFRNQERSNTHHPEFTMLEWYRAGADYEVIMQDCEHILQRVGRLAQGHSFTWNGLKCSAENGVEKISVAEAFHRYTATDLLHTITDPDSPRPDLLRVEAERMNIRCREDDSWEDIFFRIFLEKIEPKLGIGKPTILYDYPVAMAALSRPKPSNPNLAERFEIYICGLELANAFSELTDPVVQAKRFRIDMDKKFHLYGERYPIDQEFLQALELGMPDSAGIALGVDRLAMLTAGTDQLDNVLWAPVDDWSETNRA